MIDREIRQPHIPRHSRGMCVCVFFRLGYSNHDMSEKESLGNTRELNGVTVTVIPSEPFHPSKEHINTARFGKDLDHVTLMIELMCEWINMPTLHDPFEDHAERRIWESTLDRKDQQWLDENKIGGNQWSAVYLQIPALRKILSAREPELGSTLTERTKHLDEIVQRLKTYKDEGSAAREAYLAAIQELDQMARDVVTLITTPA